MNSVVKEFTNTDFLKIEEKDSKVCIAIGAKHPQKPLSSLINSVEMEKTEFLNLLKQLNLI